VVRAAAPVERARDLDRLLLFLAMARPS
jgi:hypothetical protein